FNEYMELAKSQRIEELEKENDNLTKQLKRAERKLKAYELALRKTTASGDLDQKRRVELMIAQEELESQGAKLVPIPHPYYAGISGLRQDMLGKSNIVRGSITSISRRIKSSELTPIRIGHEIWFDPLQIQLAQE